MTNYSIEPGVFDLFPAFRRAVVFAKDLHNDGIDAGSVAILANAISGAGQSPARELDRLAIWNQTFTVFGADPDRYTPSVRHLIEQIRRGKPPKPVNKLVDVMNAVSLKWTIPCGGDDLDSLAGSDLRLGFASGSETFAPLFNPGKVEHPEPGEVIYWAPANGHVMCRRWVWRNADFSKVNFETRVAAINLDFMTPPFEERDVLCAAREVMAAVQRLCGGA